MNKDLVENLHKSVEAFKTYQKQHYPQTTEENDNGEWEIGIREWDVMNSDYLWVIENIMPESSTEELLDDMLYAIARDSECSHLLMETLDYPDWFEILCRHSIKTDYYNAKWQFAEQLGSYKGNGDIKTLLLYFIESGDEYTERMALQSMCEHFPEQAEKYAVKFWERNIYPTDEYQKIMALYALHKINSPLLKEYITRAYETEYDYLKGHADKYFRELAHDQSKHIQGD